MLVAKGFADRNQTARKQTLKSHLCSNLWLWIQADGRLVLLPYGYKYRCTKPAWEVVSKGHHVPFDASPCTKGLLSVSTATLIKTHCTFRLLLDSMPRNTARRQLHRAIQWPTECINLGWSKQWVCTKRSHLDLLLLTSLNDPMLIRSSWWGKLYETDSSVECLTWRHCGDTESLWWSHPSRRICLEQVFGRVHMGLYAS